MTKVGVLPKAKHELYAQERAKGKSQEEAHKLAGYSGSRAAASMLEQKFNIAERIAEIIAEREQIYSQATAEAVERVSLTKEWILATLMDNVQRAMQAQEVTDREGRGTGEYVYQGNVANRALELLGKELGMFIDRKIVQNVDELDDISDPAELRRKLIERAERLGATDVAARLAGAEGGAGSKPH